MYILKVLDRLVSFMLIVCHMMFSSIMFPHKDLQKDTIVKFKYGVAMNVSKVFSGVVK